MDEKILVVDDDERILQTFARHLQRAGHTVFTAPGGTEALQLFDQERPAIVITDVRIPSPDGFAVLQVIREQADDVEVILITGHGDMEMAIEALRAGASDFIPKPVDPTMLATSLRHAQERLRLKRELRAVREALRASEEQYRAITEAAFVGVMVTDDENITFVNQALVEMLGYARSELVGMSLSQLTSPGEFARFREEAQRRRKGLRDQYETALYHKNGTALSVLVSVAPLQDADGRYRETLALITDISGHKWAEEQVRKLSQTVEQSPASVVITDTQGKIEYVNPAFTEYTGYTLQEVLGKTPRVLKSGVHPPEFYEQLWNTILSGKQWRSNICNRKRDGELYWELLSISPIRNTDGVITHFVAVKIDDTERVWAEQALQQRNRDLALLNRVGQELTSMLDMRQVVERLPEACTETIGAEGASVWLWDEEQDDWLVCRAVFPHDVQSRSLINLRLRPGQGVAGWVGQKGESVIIPHTSDDPRFSPEIDAQTDFQTRSLLAVPLRIHDEVLGVLEVVNKQDVDFSEDDRSLVETLAASAAIAIENARLVNALRSRSAELQARNEELDAYAHTVAHDLKNPLGLITSLAQVLELEHGRLPDEDLRRYLHTMVQSGRKMSNIIDELLLLAVMHKLEVVEMEPLDMASIVADAQGRLAYLIEEHRAEIILPDAWPTVLGRGPWVEEVWVNYISNAVKYGGRPDEGVAPRVELGFDGTATVRFWVKDNGPGIAPEDQARLFTPGTRFDYVQARGHGLGLSIAQRITKKLGGQVGVESEVGAGSLFWFTLLASGAKRKEC